MIKFDKLNIEQLQKGHISQHHIWLKYKNDVERQEFRGYMKVKTAWSFGLTACLMISKPLGK